jgi:hypothetical protein
MPALDWSQRSAVESVPGRMGGAWVFRNTRMLVSAVFENLEAGASIDEIVEAIRYYARAGQRGARVCGAQPGRTCSISVLFGLSRLQESSASNKRIAVSRDIGMVGPERRIGR